MCLNLIELIYKRETHQKFEPDDLVMKEGWLTLMSHVLMHMDAVVRKQLEGNFGNW